MENDNPYAAAHVTPDSSTVELSWRYPRRRMRFWRIEQLKAEMRAKPLSDRESLPYLLFYVALAAVASGLSDANPNLLDAMGTFLSVVITIAGTITIYRQNGGIHGQFFLQRYFAIGFVVGVRCFVALGAGMFAMTAFLDSLGRLSDETTLYEFLFLVVAEVTFYWRLARHVRDLADSTHLPETATES
jgi:hypothetical protein